MKTPQVVGLRNRSWQAWQVPPVARTAARTPSRLPAWAAAWISFSFASRSASRLWNVAQSLQTVGNAPVLPLSLPAGNSARNWPLR